MKKIKIIKVIEKIFFRYKRIKYQFRGKILSLVANGKPERVVLGEGFKARGFSNIYIYGSIYIGQRNRVETYHFSEISDAPKLILNDGVTMEDDCHIASANYVYLGKNVMLASKVYISDHSHGSTSVTDLSMAPKKRTMMSKGSVIIEDDVWIGEGAAILAGVRIGRGCVVGANSVVTKSFGPYSVVGGVPARELRNERARNV